MIPSKIIPIALLILGSLCDAQSQKSSSDFFPLTVGNRWTYVYLADDNDLLDEYAVHDSGSAVYSIISRDSTADSTVWGFSEVRDLIETISYLPPGDYHFSKYPLHDTTTFDLVEYAAGNHRLLRSANSGQFWKSVFCLTPEFSDSSAFFRFLDPSTPDTVTIVVPVPAGSPYEYLSATLKRSVGIAAIAFASEGLAGGTRYTHHSLANAALTRTVNAARAEPPKGFALENAYPNPFNPQAVISFSNESRESISINIVDVLGRKVENIFDQIAQPGRHILVWNASRAASGTYFCVARAGRVTEVIKLILIK